MSNFRRNLVSFSKGFAFGLAITGVVAFIILSILASVSCGLATDPSITTDIIEVEGPTKYKKLIVGPCSFRIDVEANIPDDWAHWRDNLQQFAVISKHQKPLERARYSTWDDLHTGVDCSFCTYGMNGLISVMDSKDNLVPWGCGVERPPLDILQVTAIYVSRKSTTSINEEASAPWEDTPLKEYIHGFIPELVSDERFCEGDPVLLDLDDVCEVLVKAGVMEKLSN